MNSSPPLQRVSDQRPSVVLPVVLVGLLLVGAAVAYKMFSSPPPAAVPVAAAPEPAQSTPAVRPIVPRADANETAAVPATTVAAPAPSVTAPTPAAPPVAREPDVDAKQLVTTLGALDTNNITPEAAQKWKESLQQLIRQGSSSVPAIHDFLAQNQDVNFAGLPGADQLAYSSLRSALLNALGQIGGPESTAAMLQTLQTSVFPTDISTLAGILEQQAPGQYQNDILTAVRTQLAAASQDQLGNANVGPLFQLLANAAASGVDISGDLSQYGGKWPFYTAIELANLPNGGGVASLVQMAGDANGGGQAAAVESLAQMAANNPQALDALLGMAKQGVVPDGILAQLAPYLGGRQNELDASVNPPGTPTQGLHIGNGNQDFAAADMNLTPDQINQRISIINQLIQLLPPDDTLSQNALQQQKGSLTVRLPK